MNKFQILFSGVTLAALAACGGGGGGGGTSDAPKTPLSLAGTAVKGGAIANAAVEVSCATGKGTATTSAAGRFNVAIDGGALPCVLRVPRGDGTYLHSAKAGAGVVDVNISPLTDVIVAQAAGVAPATLYSEFATRSASITTTSLDKAVVYERSALAASIDLTAVNPLTDTLAAGDAQDQKIITLLGQLAATGTTLAALETLVISNPTPDPIKSVVAPVTADCTRFKSGKYRVINPKETDPAYTAHVYNIDAVALTIKDPADNSTIPFASDGPGLCSFTATSPDGSFKFMVSSSGIVVVYATAAQGGATNYSIGIPEQSLSLADLAGDYNDLSFGKANPSSTGDTVTYGTATVGASGQVTKSSDCGTGLTCTPNAPPFESLAVNPSGGFLLSGKTGLYAYKNAASGRIVLVIVEQGGVSFISSVTTLALPSVDSVSKIWDFTANGNSTLSALSQSKITVTKVDTVANSATRLRDTDGRVDTVTYNNPRAGLRHRIANTCTVNGVASNCAEIIQLSLPGLTLSGSVATDPAKSFVSFSIDRP